MRFNSANARNFAALSHDSRRNNTARRIAKLAIAEHNFLRSNHPTTYIEDRLINIRSQLLRWDRLIAKSRDATRIEKLARAAKFLNDQERALSKPLTIAEQKQIDKESKQAKLRPNDLI